MCLVLNLASNTMKLFAWLVIDQKWATIDYWFELSDLPHIYTTKTIQFNSILFQVIASGSKSSPGIPGKSSRIPGRVVDASEVLLKLRKIEKITRKICDSFEGVFWLSGCPEKIPVAKRSFPSFNKVS